MEFPMKKRRKWIDVDICVVEWMSFFVVFVLYLYVHVIEEISIGIENATKLRDKQEINGEMSYSNQFYFYDWIIWVKKNDCPWW